MPYTVVKGDWLSKIATAHGTTVAALIALNPQITNPDLIRPGDVINLPGDDGGGAAAGATDEGGAVPPSPSPSSGNTIHDLPVTIDDQVIPAGATLLAVNDPLGSDAARLYFLTYDYLGVRLAYEIGDQATFAEMFPSGINAFAGYQSINQTQFDNAGYLTVGTAGEIYGSTESLGAMLDREIRMAGLGAIPQWVRDDPKAMTLLVTSAAEGWSGGRLENEWAKLDSFKTRFPAYNAVASLTGTTDVRTNIDYYIQEEFNVRSVLRRHRGANTNADNEYIGSLMATGWTATEIEPLIRAEATINQNPGMIDDLNAILRYNGLAEIDENGLIDVMMGNAPGEIYEAYNDAARRRALLDAGVDIGTGFAAALGAGTSGNVQALEEYAPAAQDAAANLMRFGSAVDLGKYGLVRDDLIAAAFGEASPSGKTVTEINETLIRLGREAGLRSGGYEAYTSYQDAEGRLRITGLQSL